MSEFDGPACRLIVTADDLGISAAVNDAVVQSCRNGILRFASLMVTGDAAAEAVDRVRKECPNLGLGLHLVLCSGRSALPAREIPGIVDAEGRFPDDPVLCGMRYFFRSDLFGQIEREMRAQFESFLSFGLRPGHVDGHVNIHMHPVIFPMLVRLAREYKFGRVRTTGGEFCASMRYNGSAVGKQISEGIVFGLLRRYLLRSVDLSKIAAAQPVFGLLRSGLMKEDYVLSCIRKLPAGTTEMYFHPSADPARIPKDRPLPGHHSYLELQSLLSPKVKEALAAAGVRLVSAPD